MAYRRKKRLTKSQKSWSAGFKTGVKVGRRKRRRR